MVTRKPLPGDSPLNNSNAAGTPMKPASAVVLEHVWGGPEADLAKQSQTNGVQNPDISRQVQVPPNQLPSPSPSGATTNNPPCEQGSRNMPDHLNNAVDKPDRVLDASRVSDRGITRSETNPFKRKPVQRRSDASNTSQKASDEASLATEPPTKQLSLLQVDEQSARSTNPWQSALGEGKGSELAPTAPSLPGQLPRPELGSQSSVLVPSEPTDNTKSASPLTTVPANPLDIGELQGDVTARKEEQSGDMGKQPAAHRPVDPSDTTSDRGSYLEPASVISSQQGIEENVPDMYDSTSNEVAARDPEELAASQSTPLLEISPPQPRPQSRATVNMSDTYQIKNINWYDANAVDNPRKSPILVQNANGPCPLVALVNAMILTTPANRTNTQLIETLASRERVSLKFLLDLVVDELMSFRHTESNIPLPDMSELYSFLKGLHTGMNVNPRFFPSSEAGAGDKITPSSDAGIPGAFEKTRDIELYATFNIPLIHGWLPPRDDPAYDALRARAVSYDDAQNLLFREEELEDKFSNSQTGLTEEEQQLYQDIITIKTFLYTTATQLTPSGLDVVSKSIKPGGVSILFRNDHFSTLYRHPQTLQLYSLVTDAGFFTHDEVVWESLVDVRGERAEFLSGDFRLVGGTQHERAGSSSATRRRSSGVPATTPSDGGWQVVQHRRSHDNRQNEPAPPTTSVVPPNEQEDRDLALALQLQEEENERHRVEVAARRRESQRQEGDGNHARQTHSSSTNGPARGSTHSLPPPRGSSMSQPTRPVSQARNPRPVQHVRSLIPPQTHRPADEGVEDAPPSYEQAAKSTPYLPPSGHPSHPSSSPRSFDSRRGPVPQRRGNAAGSSTPTRARQSVPAISAADNPAGSGKDRDCLVM